jgi:GntR family transcriptional regulator
MFEAVSRDNPLPLYKQVKSHIFEMLYGGTVPANGKVPSERELVDALGVSRITVRQALKELVSEGHLTAQPGKGFYATGGGAPQGYELELLRSFTETAVAHNQRPGSRILEVARIRADEEIARALRLTHDRTVTSLRRLRLLDGEPVAIGHDWVPLDLAPNLAELDWSVDNRSLYAELRERYGLVPHGGRTVLTASNADPDDAALLKLEGATAVLNVFQVAFDALGRPINVTRSLHHPQKYPLELEQMKPGIYPAPGSAERP